MREEVKVMVKEKSVGGGDGADELWDVFGDVLVAEVEGGFEFLGEFGDFSGDSWCCFLLLLSSSLSACCGHW